MKGRKAMFEAFELPEEFKSFLMNHFKSKCDDCESREECKKEETYNVVGDLTPTEMGELNAITANLSRLKKEAKVLSSRKELFWNKLYLRFNLSSDSRLKIGDNKLLIRDDSEEK